MLKKKICFVVASPNTVTAFLGNHIFELSQLYEVFVIANMRGVDRDIFQNLPIKKVEHVPISRKIHVLGDLRALFTLFRIFYRLKFDVVHSVTPKAGLLAMIASSLSSVETRIHIFTGQVWYTKKGLLRRSLIFLDKLIVKCATHILIDGHAQKRFLVNTGILDNSKGSVLGKGSISGVDYAKFRPNLVIRETFREELKISSEDVIFMFLGRLNRDKGVLDLVRAFQKLQSFYPTIYLFIVGPDEENLVKEIKIVSQYNEKIKFFDFTRDPSTFLAVCDVFCLPSYREGFGTSVIEASSCGKPIICSDTEGLLDTIIENETGLRHEVADIESIVNCMKKLIDNPELRLRLGEQGRKYVKRNFSSKKVTSAWMDFYKQILSDPITR